MKTFLLDIPHCYWSFSLVVAFVFVFICFLRLVNYILFILNLVVMLKCVDVHCLGNPTMMEKKHRNVLNA